MIHRVLMATDFSACSEQALEMAIELARREGATLTLLHVCQLPAYAYAAGGGGMIGPPVDLFADLLADAKHNLDGVETRLAARGVAVTTACLEGEAREAIPRFAAERGHDLIVVGSHGRRGFTRFFLGSVAEHVVRSAAVPVLVVHPPSPAAAVVAAAKASS